MNDDTLRYMLRTAIDVFAPAGTLAQQLRAAGLNLVWTPPFFLEHVLDTSYINGFYNMSHYIFFRQRALDLGWDDLRQTRSTCA